MLENVVIELTVIQFFNLLSAYASQTYLYSFSQVTCFCPVKAALNIPGVFKLASGLLMRLLFVE